MSSCLVDWACLVDLLSFFGVLGHQKIQGRVFFWKTNPRRAAPPQRLVLVFNPKYHTQNDASDDIYPLELPKTILVYSTKINWFYSKCVKTI